MRRGRRFRPQLLRLEERTLPVVTTWIGGPDTFCDGTPNADPFSWHEPSHWTQGVPGPGDTARFSADVHHERCPGAGEPGPYHLQPRVDANVMIQSLVIEEQAAETIIDLGAALTVTGASSLFGGQIGSVFQAGGVLVNKGELQLMGGADKVLGGTSSFIFQNQGIVQHRGGRLLGLNLDFQNQAAGRYDFLADGLTLEPLDRASSMLNLGTIRKAAGPGSSSIAMDLDNQGLVESAMGTLTLAAAIDQIAGSTLTGGAWTVRAGARLDLPQAPNLVTNNATVTLDGPASLFPRLETLAANGGGLTITGGRIFATAGNLANTGMVVVAANSTLGVNGSYNQTAGATVLAGGVLGATQGVQVHGGQLSGNGSIGGDLLNASSVIVGASPGILNVDGDYLQTDAGALNLELGGKGAGQFDMLNVLGQVQLNGTLNVALIDGFLPGLGDVFRVLTFGDRQGDFTRRNGLILGGDNILFPLVTAGSLDLQVERAGIVVAPLQGLATSEDGGEAQFTVVLTSHILANVVIQLASSDAGEGTVSPSTLVFTPQNSLVQQVVAIRGVDDADEDGDIPYTIVATLQTPDPFYAGRDPADVQAVNRDNEGIMVAAPQPIQEGNQGTRKMRFLVTLPAPRQAAVTVDYGTRDGTATAGRDYQAAAGKLTFNPGEVQKTVDITVRGDRLDEVDETFQLVLANAQGVRIAMGQATGTILDDDASPRLSLRGGSVLEGDQGQVGLNFTLTLSAASGRQVMVLFAAQEGTAAAGVDFLPTNGAAVFQPGERTKTVAVPILGDLLDEDNETLFLNLANPDGAFLAQAQARGSIRDNDRPPRLTIIDVRVAEGDEGPVDAVFVVQLSAASGRRVTVVFATANGTARAGQDYVAFKGTLTFAPGENEKTIVIPVQGDRTVEPDETFRVNLSLPTNAALGAGKGTGTIVNDDLGG